MNVEIHLIQSFAPSCLNRDDTNAPKSCFFGGVRRARISSQCLKRTMRLHMRDAGNLPTGRRTRLLAGRLALLAEERYQRSQADAEPLARLAIRLAGIGSAEESPERTSVGLYLADDEIGELARAIHDDWDKLCNARAELEAQNDDRARGKREEQLRKDLKNVAPEVYQAFAAIGKKTSVVDIALFGRMVAERTHMKVDAACQVAHAISTHEVDAEMDYFTAVDDLQPEEEPGAGMLGIVEFNAACFYRYALINRGVLEGNLQGTEKERRNLANGTLLAFVRASLEAIPTARQNSMAAQNRPDYLLVRVGSPTPMSLANAFENPVRAGFLRPGEEGRGLTELSVGRLREYEESLCQMYDESEGDERFCSTFSLDGRISISGLLAWLKEKLEAA